MKTLCGFIKKHRDILSYLFFGGLTTVISFVVYFSLFHKLHLTAALCNVIAWIAAVAFAFVTNKPFVFHSSDWSLGVVFPELGKFVGSRIFSGFLETAFLALTVDLLHLNNTSMKIIASVIVVVLNYVASKLLVFRNTENS